MKLDKIKCMLNFHDWIITSSIDEEKIYGKGYSSDYDLNPTTRTCACCKKKEYLEIHCLGFKPEKYYKHWTPIKNE